MDILDRLQNRDRFDIWQFQASVSRRLLVWAVANIVLGIGLQQRQNKVLRGVGMQAISWGAINALIAIIGDGVARLRRSRMNNPYARDITQKETRNLFRALWINGVLDVFYVIGGVLLALTRGKTSRLMRGSGWGIVIQGGFLFVFDWLHVWLMNRQTKR